MGKYNYLRKYIENSLSYPNNWFERIRQDEIDNAERELGFELPKALKEFWLEIGCGFLKKSITGIATTAINRIMDPCSVADMILLRHEDCVLPDIEELFDEGWIDIEKGEIIFFEIGDSSSFLVMKPNSIKPDGVYDMLGRLMIDSFEEFIWRLYHESPDFYLYLDYKNSPENLAILEQKRDAKKGA